LVIGASRGVVRSVALACRPGHRRTLLAAGRPALLPGRGGPATTAGSLR